MIKENKQEGSDFIRISFKTIDKKSKKEGKIIANIFDGKAIIKFDNQEQMEFTYGSLMKSGKKAIKSRGYIIQFFTGKLKEEIKDIFKEDIKLGIQGAGKLKKDILIKDYKEEIIR